MKFKKILLAAALLPLALCSCIEVRQTIAMKGGKYEFSYRFMFSNEFISMASAIGGEDFSLDGYLKEIEQQFPEGDSSGVSTRRVRTADGQGVEVFGLIDPKNPPDGMADQIPQKRGPSYMIPADLFVAMTDEIDDDEKLQMADATFSLTIAVDDSFIRNAGHAYLTDSANSFRENVASKREGSATVYTLLPSVIVENEPEDLFLVIEGAGGTAVF